MLDEVVATWAQRHLIAIDRLPKELRSERNLVEDFDFDGRLVSLLENARTQSDKEWMKIRKRAKELSHLIDKEAEGQPRWGLILVIDRIDDAWNGSHLAVVLLMALMHACVELAAQSTTVHPLLFLRENLFQRVKHIDSEFTRLETAVVSLDWTEELLIEMIERRLKASVTTAPPTGQAWDAFFEFVDGKPSHQYVLEFCQHRPRDVLILCSTAIEEAQSHKHEKVTANDLIVARRKFSLSRLKDVGDEYSENYPQIQIILGRFHGLGDTFTFPALAEFIQKLVASPEVQRQCGGWLSDYVPTHRFATLLYNIGFIGFKSKGDTVFRSHEASAESPAIDDKTQFVIHPCYSDALSLQPNMLVTSLQGTPLQFALAQDFRIPAGVLITPR